MTTTPVDALTGSNTDYGIFAASNASTAASSSSTSSDSQMFLQLMVAQMQYQDPDNPTDTSTMLQQNATFTEVQAVQEMTQEMQMMLSSQVAFGGAAMVGKQVSYVDGNGDTQTGTVQGASFTGSGPVLNIDGTSVPLNSIASIGDTGTPSATTGATTSPTTTAS